MILCSKPLLRRALLCFAAVFIPLTLPAATINVPADQKTIQAGIDAASDGDTVLVAPGTYDEHIDFKGNAITVTSSAGATATTIDGGYMPGLATVQFATGETNTSVISGFTIRGGGNGISPEASDGGIFVGGTSPTIENNTITANYCHNIDVQGGAAAILNNTISGVLLSPSPAHPCGFSSAIYLQVVAGVSTSAGSAIIGNTVENNLTGTAIEMFGGKNNLIMNNIIRNNTSPEPGSAVNLDGESTVLVQNLIYGNISTCGGAIAFSNAGSVPGSPSILVANNTIVDNSTSGNPTGSECTPIAQIYPDPYSYGASDPSALIVNNIVSGSTSYPAVNCYLFHSPSEALQPTFEYDILYNSAGPFFGSRCIDVKDKYNNVVADPQFVDAPAHDYHLKKGSPAIDAGLNSVVQTFLTMTGRNFTTDFDGNPRLQDATGQGCTIDMGAYEYSGSTTDCSSTTVKLTSSLNPSPLGQTVTFTAQLSSTSSMPTGDVQFTDGSSVLGTVALSDTGSAAFSSSQLNIGSHTITAAYLPSGTLPSATATLTQVVNGYATTTTLASSTNPANVGQSVTFTATVTSPNGTPSGRITFSDGTTILGTQALVDGVAAYTTNSLAAGLHTIVAAYNPGAASYSINNATLSQTVNGVTTATSLDVSPATGAYGTNILMTSTVILGGTPNSTGGITFMDGAVAISSGELLPGSSTSSYNDIYLSVGTHSITAVYSGDATHNASTSRTVTVTITAVPTTLTLTAAPNPGFALQPIVLAAKLAAGNAGSNAINFLANGILIGAGITDNQGNARLTAVLPTGNYSLVATFVGSGNLGASTSAPVAEIVHPNPSATAVYAQPNPGYQGGNEALTATVNTIFASSANPPVPSGGVTFLDSGTPIATVSLDTKGQVTFSTTNFTVGTHAITAVYSGTANFLASTAPAYALTILPRDFTLTTDPSITIQTQHHKDLNLTLGSVGDFSDTIALSCANLPAYATCTFPSNGPLLAAGSTLPSTVHLDTDALLNFLASRKSAARPTELHSFRKGIALALLVPIPLIATLRRRRSLRRTLRLFGSLCIFAIAATFTGCSSHYPGHTPPGTYSFTVTGQGAATHITHAATVTFIVTE